MNFEERLRAAIEDKYCEEILTGELTGIPRVYQVVDNAFIRLARETNHLTLYVKDDYNIIINYQKSGRVNTETIYFSSLGVDLTSPEHHGMDGGRLLYYIYENHSNDKGIKIIQYKETGDGDKEYPGLNVEFVRKEVLRPLSERIHEVKECVNAVENKDAAWKKSIAASVIDLAEEKLNDEILKIVAAGKKVAAIYIAGNNVLVSDVTDMEESKVKYYGISVKIPDNMPKKSISCLGKNLDTIIRNEIKTILLKYYKDQGISISEQEKTIFQIGGEEVKLKLCL